MDSTLFHIEYPIMTGKGFVIPSITTEDVPVLASTPPPPLPERDFALEGTEMDPPNTPPPQHQPPLANPLNLEVTTTQLDFNDFKLDRSEGVLFSPASVKTGFNVTDGVINDISEPPILPPRAPQLPERKPSRAHYHHAFPPGMDPVTQTLISERQCQVDFAIDEFTNAGFTRSQGITSDDTLIEAECAVKMFDYDSVDKHLLYKVLLETKKIDGTIFDMVEPLESSPLRDEINQLVESLSVIFKATKLASSGELMDKFQNDLIKIYQLLSTTSLGEGISPSPLVVVTLLFCGDVLVTLVTAFVIHHFILNSEFNDQFRFSLFRSVEDVNPFKMLELVTSGVEVVQSQITKSEFWLHLVLKWDNDNIIPKVFNNLIMYGPLSLIGDSLGCFTQSESPAIPRFDKHLIEFNGVNDNKGSENLKVADLKDTNVQLSEYLAGLKQRYTDLLTNFQQLNGESMRVKALIKMKREENDKLKTQSAGLQGEVEAIVGHYEVLRVRLEKNKEMEAMNEAMRLEIERMKH